MIKKIGTLLASAGLLLGAGLATAAPASAADQPGAVQVVWHQTGGLGGNVGIRRGDAGTFTIAEGQKHEYRNPAYAASAIMKEVRAGNGYCVWEQSYSASGSNLRSVKVVDRTYGKSMASSWHTLGSYTRIKDQFSGVETITTDLRIFAC